MYFFLVIYLLVSLILIFLIMLQYGKGMDVSGDSFNPRNFLGGMGNNHANMITRLTTVLGILFFLLSLLLGNMSNKCSNENYVDNDGSLKKIQDKIHDVDNTIHS